MVRDIGTIKPAGTLSGAAPKEKTANSKANDFAFAKALELEFQKSQALKFSAHAEKRLKERNIVLANEDLAKIDKAVRQAEAKGSRESLIIYGDLALITSIRNKTVVTAVDGKSSEDHVFTNIDSAVIVK